QLAKEAIDIVPGLLRLAAVGLGLNQVPVARDSLHRAPEIWHRAILVGQIKERYSSIQGMVDQPVKAFLAQSSLIRGMVDSNRSRADPDQRDHQAALPQFDFVGRTLDRWINCKCGRTGGRCRRKLPFHQGSGAYDSCCGNRSTNKVAAT